MLHAVTGKCSPSQSFLNRYPSGISSSSSTKILLPSFNYLKWTGKLSSSIRLCSTGAGNEPKGAATSSSVSDASPKKSVGFFHPQRIVAPAKFNRWKLVLPSVLTHLCLGSVFAWSIFNDLLIRELGVVVSSAGDWTLSSVVPVFSLVLAMHGLSAAVVGKWQEEVGPRKSSLLGSIFFGGGFILGGFGVIYHQLPLLYLGYGFFGGLGMGLAYVPPVATLIRWFPDKRGMATGLTIMGFGGGALVATPISTYLVKKFQVAPEYIGSTDTVTLITQNGRQYAEIAGQLREVVVATASDVMSSSVAGLKEGIYLVGTGSTGAGLTLVALGAGYFAVMLLSAISYRTPPRGYAPAGWKPPPKSAVGLISSRNVHIDDVMKTPQFWQIWIAFGALSTAGMAVISVAKTMMFEIFSKALPLIVTGTFTSGYVMAISAANLGGRIGWSSASDYLGRKNVFTIFFVTCIPLFFLIPYFAEQVTISKAVLPLGLFYVSTLVIYSMFGAGYATTPAYEADLFGQKYCGAIHGRMLTASSMASILGPYTLTMMRNSAELKAIHELVSKVDPAVFYAKFGAPLTELEPLIKAKTVTINKLMQISPPGTIDPTPFLYNTPLYAAAGLLALGLIANYTIKPVDPKFMMKDDTPTVVSEVAPPKFTYLVCVNGTEYADAAFQYAIKIINKEKERLLILAVDFSHNTAFNNPEFLAEDLHADKRQVLMKYAKTARDLGLDFSTILAIGPNIGDAICFTAKHKKVDLLLLGSNKRKTISTMLGTISKYCADNAACNIMFVKNKENEQEPHTFNDKQYKGESLGDWQRTHLETSKDIQAALGIFELKNK